MWGDRRGLGVIDHLQKGLGVVARLEWIAGWWVMVFIGYLLFRICGLWLIGIVD